MHVQGRNFRYLRAFTKRLVRRSGGQEAKRKATRDTDQVYAGSVEQGREVLHLQIYGRHRLHNQTACRAYYSGLIFRTFPLYSTEALFETRIVRGWIERLFGRPWKPLQKYATEYQHGVFLKWYQRQNVLVAHPLTVGRLTKEAFDDSSREDGHG